MSEIALSSWRDLAQRAINKESAFGADIDPTQYTQESEEHSYQSDPSKLPSDEKEHMMSAGIMLDDLDRLAGTYIQKDQTPVHFHASQEGIEVMSITEALDTYSWINEYIWKSVEVGSDKYTAHLELNDTNGYFIRSLPGMKAQLPVQACLYLGHRNLAQRVHNVVIAEEYSELHIITGCTAHPMSGGLHLGVSEFYVKQGAKLTFTMIHNWAPNISVRPRSVVTIEKDGIYLNNYISMKPVQSIQMYPTAKCIGENAIARFSSIIIAPPGSDIDVGSRVILDAERSHAEIISRTITTGGTIVARGDIQANKPNVKGHLECRGLILGKTGVIHAIPELIGRVAGVDLSHEAAVGKIAEEEIEYLMARGLPRDEATAMIVRGFLNVNIQGLSIQLENEIKKVIDQIDHGSN